MFLIPEKEFPKYYPMILRWMIFTSVVQEKQEDKKEEREKKRKNRLRQSLWLRQ